MNCDSNTFDPGLLIGKLDGDEELARDLLQAFVEDAPARLDGLEQALAGEDAPRATEMAHSLKGMCGVVRVQRLVDYALSMEQAGRTGKLDRLREYMMEFSACLEQVLTQVHSYLES